VTKKSAAQLKKTEQKKDSRVARYFREVRAEIRKVIWPNRRTATNLTAIVLGVTTAVSIALGLLDWLFTQLFTLIIG